MDLEGEMRKAYDLLNAGDLGGDDGVGVEHWGLFDAMKMMQQLGLVPEGAVA
jgi:hypothetical protein